jgi:protein SCO1/2
VKQRIYIAVGLWLLAVGTILPALAHHGESQRVNLASQGWPVDSFTLVDQYGKTFTQERLQGQWTFVLFGDTHCAQPCTAALSALVAMHQRIAPTAAVKTTQVLFVSLDPERDTPEILRRYLVSFDERFIGVSGSWQTLTRLTGDLGVSLPNPLKPAARVDNTSYAGSLVLVGPDGVVRAELLPPFDALLLTAEYLKTRARR